jgi:hypothetical protein
MRSFLQLYLLSGVAGGLLQTIGGICLPGHFGAGFTVGASAGVFGLVAAFATMYPEQPLTMLVALIIPISMRAKYLLLVSGLLALFGVLVPVDRVAHMAHLGGLLAGMAYVAWMIRPAEGLFGARPREESERARELVRAAPAPKSQWRKQGQTQPGDLTPSEYISRKVDPILDKISARGIGSLTTEERRILEEARRKMGKP